EAQTAYQEVYVECVATGSQIPPLDSEVDEMVIRLEVYRAERAAQWAQEGGRRGLSTVRLREASKLLRRLGEGEIATEFERQAEDVERDELHSDHTKMVKDWVR